jgi:hypothetical protein
VYSVCAALKLIDMPEDPLNGVQSIASTAGILNRQNL